VTKQNAALVEEAAAAAASLQEQAARLRDAVGAFRVGNAGGASPRGAGARAAEPAFGKQTADEAVAA
jgi:methyl-accepting chemotaxis protein